mmetsp:Transcript_4759/g.6549  ORF Transcript_4759/g.6549 Transcript_4759/m.6549 type:complete len:108 (+) Transcript_4759:267-590(+)
MVKIRVVHLKGAPKQLLKLKSLFMNSKVSLKIWIVENTRKDNEYVNKLVKPLRKSKLMKNYSSPKLKNALTIKTLRLSLLSVGLIAPSLSVPNCTSFSKFESFLSNH